MAIGVYCLDVGQGQRIALIGPSPDGYEAALIDVGADGERLGRWLEGIGVRRIPLVVLTHNHADHIKGLTSLVEAFTRDVGDVRGAPLMGTHPGRGANAVSAIIRLVRAGEPDGTIALFGGDLTFRG